MQAPGKPPEKSSLSGAAEGEVGRDGGPSVTGEGRESARERAASAREARNQVVPRICIRPEPEGLGRFSFWGKGIMVFCVRGTLLEEDRAAWRRLKAQRERAARKKHQKAVRGWFGDKLCGFGIMMYGILALCLAIYDGMRIGGTICGLLMTFGGLWMFVSLGRRPPACRTRLSGRRSLGTDALPFGTLPGRSAWGIPLSPPPGRTKAGFTSFSRTARPWSCRSGAFPGESRRRSGTSWRGNRMSLWKGWVRIWNLKSAWTTP